MDVVKRMNIIVKEGQSHQYAAAAEEEEEEEEEEEDDDDDDMKMMMMIMTMMKMMMMMMMMTMEMKKKPLFDDVEALVVCGQSNALASAWLRRWVVSRIFLAELLAKLVRLIVLISCN